MVIMNPPGREIQHMEVYDTSATETSSTAGDERRNIRPVARHPHRRNPLPANKGSVVPPSDSGVGTTAVDYSIPGMLLSDNSRIPFSF